MRTYPGRVSEIILNPDGDRSAMIECPDKAVPPAGRYMLAQDRESILSTPLFLAGYRPGGFLAAAPVPETWAPGMALDLRGPLGNGFQLPATLQRLAAIAVETSGDRLLPLVREALERGAAVTLFGEAIAAGLPAPVEAYPLSAFSEAQGWADFLAADVPFEALTELRGRIGRFQASFPCPGQTLVFAPMPCGGLGECGVCAVTARRGWKLTCKDGPVFNLRDIA